MKNENEALALLCYKLKFLSVLSIHHKRSNNFRKCKQNWRQMTRNCIYQRRHFCTKCYTLRSVYITSVIHIVKVHTLHLRIPQCFFENHFQFFKFLQRIFLQFLQNFSKIFSKLWNFIKFFKISSKFPGDCFKII